MKMIVVVGIAAQNNALALGTLKPVTKIILPIGSTYAMQEVRFPKPQNSPIDVVVDRICNRKFTYESCSETGSTEYYCIHDSTRVK
jgi:hypothetical protein